jgi:hypothetical protein
MQNNSMNAASGNTNLIASNTNGSGFQQNNSIAPSGGAVRVEESSLRRETRWLGRVGESEILADKKKALAEAVILANITDPHIVKILGSWGRREWCQALP